MCRGGQAELGEKGNIVGMVYIPTKDLLYINKENKYSFFIIVNCRLYYIMDNFNRVAMGISFFGMKWVSIF